MQTKCGKNQSFSQKKDFFPQENQSFPQEKGKKKPRAAGARGLAWKVRPQADGRLSCLKRGCAPPRPEDVMRRS